MEDDEEGQVGTMDIYDMKDMEKLLADQALVHERNGGCVGLPFCVSCRASVLLNNGMDVVVAEAWINTQPAGTVVLVERK